MKRFFYKPLSLVLALAMLFFLTGVAENESTVDANGDESNTSENVDIFPVVNEMGDSSGNDLEEVPLGDILLDDSDNFPIEIEEIPVEITGDNILSDLELGEEQDGLDVPDEEIEIDSTETNKTKKTSVPKALKLGKGETYSFDIKNATFSTTKQSVATVSKNGVITAKTVGTATITVKSGNKTLGTCKVTVLDAPDRVSIKPMKQTLPKGGTKTLKVTLPDKTASNKLTWKSSNKKVVTVDENGVVKGVKVGTAKITVTTFNKKIATCTITVNNDPYSLSFPSKSISIGLTESVKIKPVVNKGSKPKYTWSSKNKKVATVDKNGKITGVKAGTTTITVTTQNDLKAQLTVKVLKKPTSVTLSEEQTVEVGNTLQLKAELKPNKSGSYKMTWKSSDNQIAKVDANGVVTGLNAGSATITVTTFNKLTATCIVTVITPQTTPTPPEDTEPVASDFVMANGVVTGYTGIGGDIVIPSVDGDGNAITAIGEAAFKNNSTITKVSISSNVTSIGESAFEGCTGLECVDIPNGVTIIGKAAFKNCGKLSSMIVFG